jgi:hypothetical protein
MLPPPCASALVAEPSASVKKKSGRSKGVTAAALASVKKKPVFKQMAGVRE